MGTDAPHSGHVARPVTLDCRVWFLGITDLASIWGGVLARRDDRYETDDGP
jgi:hypothetical protein